MSRYYGTLNAGRSTATKCGHAANGLSASCRGWNVGADCWIHPDRNNPEADAVVIEVTAGTNGNGPRLHLATFTRDNGPTFCTGGRLADLLQAVQHGHAALSHLSATAKTAEDRDEFKRRAAAAWAALAAFGEGVGHE